MHYALQKSSGRLLLRTPLKEPRLRRRFGKQFVVSTPGSMRANHNDSRDSKSTIQEEMQQQLKDKTLFEEAKQYAFEYMNQVDTMPVFPTPESLQKMKETFHQEPLPEQTHPNASLILQQLSQYGSPATTASTGGRYFGYVTGSAIPTATAVRWMVDSWDQNSALWNMSPIAAQLEHVTEEWCVDLLGLGSSDSESKPAMGLVGGSSVANLCGLAAGRNFILKNHNWNVHTQGLFGAPPIRVVVNEEAHSSIAKALGILGLGSERVERAKADKEGRIIVNQLPKLDSNTILILQAGHVCTGAFDNFDEICDKANQAGAWVHIDGAFGLWAAASRNLRHLAKGMEKADSWSVDAHKTLNTPYDCGIVLCKDRTALRQAMAATGSYITPAAEEESRDGLFYTPDMSRRARSIELWATIKYLGRQGVEELIDTMVERAQQFGRLLQDAHFHVENDIVFNQCLIKCDSPEETNVTLTNVQQSKVMWCGGATWQGQPAIRISVCSWSTTTEDVERSVEALIEAREKYRSL